MYDPKKRVALEYPTVEELIDALQKLPQGATISCCGQEYFWLHTEIDGSAVCIDNDALDEEYDDAEGEDGEED